MPFKPHPRPIAALLALLLVACSAPKPMGRAVVTAETRQPISFRQLLERPRAKADVRIAYGPGPQQFGELWLPDVEAMKRDGRFGPWPVAVLIHGGCWRADLPGLELMDYMAEALRADGWAVWNLEYRRIGHPGGGYPGTFQDIAAGVDHLERLSSKYPLNRRAVVLSGHSAGGHLALWAALRERLPASSPLHTARPFPVQGVVTLAGINDLADYRANGPEACGGPETIDRLVDAGRGGASLYADTSPPQMLPSRRGQSVISGELDHIVPPRFGKAYSAAAKQQGVAVREVTLPGAGHFELIDPTSAAWPTITYELERVGRQ